MQIERQKMARFRVQILRGVGVAGKCRVDGRRVGHGNKARGPSKQTMMLILGFISTEESHGHI